MLLAALAGLVTAHTANASSAPAVDLYPLLYQRSAAPADISQAAQIVMVGDVSMARGTAQVIAKRGSDFDYPLHEVSDWLRAADLAVGNQEGVIAPESIGPARTGGYRLRADPAAAFALARAGFGLLNLANNHTLDFGPSGLRVTLETLQQAGIQTMGAGKDYDSARRALITTLRGVKIAWVSFDLISDPSDVDIATEGRDYGRARFEENKLTAQIQSARLLASVVIVQFHWGNEYQSTPTALQVRLGRAAIDAGASLVVGHHPHVIQTIEVYRNRLIVYSLGNFLFDQDNVAGLVLWLRVDASGVLDAHALTVHPGVHPLWDSPARATADLRDACNSGEPSVQFAAFGFNGIGYVESNQPVDPLQLQPRATTLDMRGDGSQEKVTLSDGVLRLLDGDTIVYESYPPWPVVDFAVGDPNQDGRFEVLMLLWKQDTHDAPVTTHPFIVGYRNGKYSVVWGGSATENWV